MFEKSNLLLSEEQNDDLIQIKDSRIMKIQHNLIMMGYNENSAQFNNDGI